jgi:hypothetical protein
MPAASTDVVFVGVDTHRTTSRRTVREVTSSSAATASAVQDGERWNSAAMRNRRGPVAAISARSDIDIELGLWVSGTAVRLDLWTSRRTN